MLRLLSAFCFALVCWSTIGGLAAAEAVDRGPPYSNDGFLSLAPSILPNGFRRILPEWWAKAPEYLKQRVLAAPSRMWWPIVLCNYMGFKPGGTGFESAEACEKSAYDASQRGKNSWSTDGQWVGPSDECVKRDKRSKWGELVCD